MTAVVGIDPSLRRTGLCKVDGTTVSLALRPGRDVTAFPDWFSIAAKANTIRDWVWPHCVGADLLVIEVPPVVEGHESAVKPLEALQWALLQRVRAEDMWDRLIRPIPAEVQAFARNGPVIARTFHGMAPKDRKRAMEDLARDSGWAGPHAGGSNDDEGEAWWMWALGRHVLGDVVVEPSKYRDRKAREFNQQLDRWRRSRRERSEA